MLSLYRSFMLGAHFEGGLLEALVRE